MSTELHGWLEYRRFPKQPRWWAAIPLQHLVADENRAVWGSLFLPDQPNGFRPLGPRRGLPEDWSFSAEKDYPQTGAEAGRGRDATWVTWSEVEGMAWDELAPRYSPGPVVYRPGGGGLVRARVGDPRYPEVPAPGAELEWTEGEDVYRYERPTRRQALERSRGWRVLVGMARVVAKQFGDENVRLTVWFVEA